MVRRILIVLAVVAAVIALAAAAVFLPPVQRWVILRLVPLGPGARLDVERVVVRSGSIVVRNLDYAWPGGWLTLANGTVALPVGELLFHGRAVIADARLTGLKIGFQRPLAMAKAGALAAIASPEREAGGVPAFDGVLKHLPLPLGLVLERCRVEAEIEYPHGRDNPARHVRLTLTGGHLAPGREARFDFQATLRNPDPRAPVDTVETRGDLQMTLARDAAFEKLGVHLDAEASGPRLVGPTRLQADIALARNPGGENYTLSLSAPESGVPDHLLGLDCAYATGSAQLTGTWQVRANDGQIAPFILGAALPQFSALGEGRFEFNPATLATRLAGRLSGEFSRLEVIDPRLREFNGLSATTSFDVDDDGTNVRVAALSASFEGRRPLLAVQTIQPFSLELASHRLSAADPAKELLKVEIQGLPLAWARPWLAPTLALGGGELAGAVDVELRGDHVRIRTRTPLTAQNLTLAESGRVLLPPSDVEMQAEVEYTKAESWLRLGQLVLRTAAGDRLDARATVQLGRDGKPEAAAQAEFNGSLPTLLAAWAPGVPMAVHGALSGAKSGNTLRIDRLALAAETPAGQPLVEFSLDRALEVDWAGRKVTAVSGQPGEVARLKLGRVPLSVLRPYVGSLTLGGFVQGELAVESRAEGLRMATAGAWQAEGFSVESARHAWVRDLIVELEGEADYAPEGLTGKITELRARTAAGATLLTGHTGLEVKFGGPRPSLQGSATFELAVPALADQPVLGPVVPPQQGKLSGELSFSRDRDLLGSGRLTFNGLASPATGVPLPVVNLSFRAGVSDAGDMALQAPLLIDRAGERSDLTLAATVHSNAAGRFVDAKLSSAHLVIDDVLALTGAFAVKPPGPAAAEAPSPGPTLNGQAPWAGLTGQIAVGLKSVSYGPTTELTGVGGRIVIDPGRIVAEQIAARVGADGQGLLNARVDFSAGDPQPWTSLVDLAVQDFDVGPYFKAAAPDRAPAVEGRFNIRWRAAGAGRNLAELIDRTRGAVVFQSRKGVFRGLLRPPPPPPPSGIVGGAKRVLSDIGEKVGSLVVSSDAADALADLVAAIPYDQLNLRAARDPAGDVKLSDFSLVSPVMRLQGDGLITNDPAKGVLDQAMQLRLSMGVMGAVENALTKAKSSLVPGDRDDLGYLKLRDPFVLGGTLARPDSSQFHAMVSRSVLDILRR